MIIRFRKIVYELISGPLRALKIGLLSSFVIIIVGMLTVLFIPSSYEYLSVLAYGNIAGLLILIIIIQLRGSAKLNDLHYQLSLQENLAVGGYRLKDVYLDGAAGNASLMLLLLKCLQLGRPRKILELGSGQTTKMLSYYCRANPETYILTLEQEKNWIEILRPYLTDNGPLHEYRFAELRDKEFICPGTNIKISTSWFHGVQDLLTRRFNLILIDGPNGEEIYSRSGILEYLPAILDDTFVIILDDAERYGEITTIRLLKKLLISFKIDYSSFEVNGIKRQYVFCSRNLAFLQYT